MYVVVRANSTSGPWIVGLASEWDIRASKADILAWFGNRREAEKAARRANTPDMCWRCGARVSWDNPEDRAPHVAGTCDDGD